MVKSIYVFREGVALKVLVVADDLTGACDAGIQFVEVGLSTIVLMRPVKDFHGECEVLAVNTETRNKSDEEAYSIVRKISEHFKGAFQVFYKKIDSTMRGHIRVEVEAMLEGLDLRAAIVTPAYPENGRIVLDGYLFVNGELLEKTEFAEQREGTSYIPGLLHRENSGEVSCMDISLIRRGINAVKDRVKELVQGGVRIIVADAMSRSDLRCIAEACLDMDEKLLFCGSAGLAEEVAHHIVRKGKAVLVVSGSLKRETLRQIEEVKRRFSVGVFKLSPQAILKEEPSEALLDSLLREIKRRRVAVLTSAASGDDKIPGAEKAACRTLSRAVRHILEELRADLILTGGDTAASILSDLAVYSLKPIEEVGEGIPLNEILDGRWRGVKVITKAGGFGSTEVLADIVDKLVVGRRNS